jgi:hypothetical protein
LDVATSSFRAVVEAERRTLSGRYTQVAGRWLALVVDWRAEPAG